MGFALKTKVCPQTTPDKMIEIIKTDFHATHFILIFLSMEIRLSGKENMLPFLHMKKTC